MTLREQVDMYYQRLLTLQFEASECIEHNPTKGSMREDFIMGLLEGCYPHATFGKGIISKDEWESAQSDLILFKDKARINKFGEQNIADLDDCSLIMEVKSNAISKYFEKFNTEAKEAKDRCVSKLTCGMFCYNIDLKPETIIERFGFKYEKPPLDLFIPNKSDIQYPNIDFIFTLECKNENKPYLIIKNIDNTYQVFLKNPIIKYFLDIFKMIEN